MRIGFGYDVHKLAEERKLILGGVEVPFEKGLLGHSDADVLLHSIVDALLGALGLGDIGRHFPDTDPVYKGISSIKLLSNVYELLKSKGFEIVNIDSTIVAQKPKLAEYIPSMTGNIAMTLNCSQTQINVKAKTEEGLGFTGSAQGIKAYAVALIQAIGNR